MAYRPLSAVVLAAGEGTRMRSNRPKPLHFLCGRPMLLHILDALAQLPIERAVVVVGHGADPVTRTLEEHGPPELAIDFVEQREQRGTGDAAMAALTAFPDDLDEDDILVLPGDTPLLRPETLAAVARHHRVADAGATVMTARLADPGAYGRVVRNKSGNVARIVEAADASPEELEVDEINTGIYCFRRSILAPAIRRTTPDNAQGEQYLTDVIEVLAEAGYAVAAVEVDDPSETVGINDRAQLAAAEATLRARINRRLLDAGVTMPDPTAVYVDAAVEVGVDATLWPGTTLQGRCRIGSGCRIGPHTRLVDCEVGDGATVEQTTARDAVVGEDAWVGPYAVLEPGAKVAPGERTGPFYTSGDSGHARGG